MHPARLSELPGFAAFPYSGSARAPNPAAASLLLAALGQIQLAHATPATQNAFYIRLSISGTVSVPKRLSHSGQILKFYLTARTNFVDWS